MGVCGNINPRRKSFENQFIKNRIRNSLCEIYKNNKFSGFGVLCWIFDSDNLNKKFLVLITSINVLNKDEININDNNNFVIEIKLNNSTKLLTINKQRKILPYNENNCEITIVEILKKDKIDANDVFELDDFFYKNDVKEIDKNKYIYLSDTSENIIKMKLSDIYENNLKIILQSGTPIINIDNYKLLGIYCGQNKSGNNISLFKKPITSYNKIIQKEKEEKNKNNSNEIYLILNVGYNKIWMSKYYFLCTTDKNN